MASKSACLHIFVIRTAVNFLTRAHQYKVKTSRGQTPFVWLVGENFQLSVAKLFFSRTLDIGRTEGVGLQGVH